MDLGVLIFEFAAVKKLDFQTRCCRLSERQTRMAFEVCNQYSQHTLWCKWPCGMFVESTLHMQAESNRWESEQVSIMAQSKAVELSID